jgi:hypothetical protein
MKGILNVATLSTQNARRIRIALSIAAALLGRVAMTHAAPENRAQTTITGSWGGTGTGLEAPEGEEARVELDCAHGSIPAPLTVAGDGSFDWRGTFVPERGGPTRQKDLDQAALAARYRGTLEGERLTITIERASSAPMEVVLFRNRVPRIRKCR